MSALGDDRQLDLPAIVVVDRRARASHSRAEPRARGEQVRVRRRCGPARLAGRCGITASVSASPSVTRSGGLPK